MEKGNELAIWLFIKNMLQKGENDNVRASLLPLMAYNRFPRYVRSYMEKNWEIQTYL